MTLSKYLPSFGLLALSPNYIRSSLIGGSVLFLICVCQVVSGFLIAVIYCFVFDVGLAGVLYFWWETFEGAMLARFHSEFGNIFFLLLYTHISMKIWNASFFGENDQTWISGFCILICSYLAGITGAIMPCSILSEVTATVIGYAINSLSFINFDFLGTFMIPGLGLTDDTLFRVFLLHALFPVLMFVYIIEHTGALHVTEYTDEDEMDILALSRFEYWDDFIWVEFFCWFEMFLTFLTLRFIVDFFWPKYMTVSYSCSNFEFWPLQEDIDFVLAIPHWYLRPLMSSLVVIPHHYMGFFYVIFFFLCVILLPWFASKFKVSNSCYIFDYVSMRFSVDLFSFSVIIFFLFVLALAYTSLIVPTGRYFVSLGSNEVLVFIFWFILTYLFLYRIITSFTAVFVFYTLLNK